jgi:protein gp37
VPGEIVNFLLQAMGGANKKKAGRELEGRMWDEMPDLPELHKNRPRLYTQG